MATAQRAMERDAQTAENSSSQATSLSQRTILPSGTSSKTAQALGWFSIGLGLAEIAAPRALARLIGVGNHPALFRLLGAREIASGVAILASGRRPTTAVWSRVAGDAIDLALLGAAFTSPTAKKGRLALATAAVLGVTALDIKSGQALSENAAPDGSIVVERSITIGRTPEELFRIWRDPNTAPQVMSHFAEITPTGDRTARWKVGMPLGQSIEWDTQIVEETPGELIRWQSQEGATIPNEGSIEFRPAPVDRGTEVTLRFRFMPPNTMLALAFNKPHEKLVGETLHHFKSLVEAGEMPTLRTNVSGRGKGDRV